MLNPFIIAQVMAIISMNPYSCFFHTLGNSKNIKNFEIWIISSAGLDHCFNVSSSSQVAEIWVESENLGQQWERDIEVFNDISGSQII